MTEERITGPASAMSFLIERLPIGDREWNVWRRYEELVLYAAMAFAALGTGKPAVLFVEASRYAARTILDMSMWHLSLRESLRSDEFFEDARLEVDRRINALCRRTSNRLALRLTKEQWLELRRSTPSVFQAELREFP